MAAPPPTPETRNLAWAHARRLAAKGLLHLAAGHPARPAIEEIHATAVGQLARAEGQDG